MQLDTGVVADMERGRTAVVDLINHSPPIQPLESKMHFQDVHAKVGYR